MLDLSSHASCTIRRETIMIIMRAIDRSCICCAMILAMYIFHVYLLTNLRLDDYEEMRARIRWLERMIPWRHRIWIQWSRSKWCEAEMKLSMIIMLVTSIIIVVIEDYDCWIFWHSKMTRWGKEYGVHGRDDLDPWSIVFRVAWRVLYRCLWVDMNWMRSSLKLDRKLVSKERIERRTRNVKNIHECDVRQHRNVISFFSSLLSFSFVMVVMIIWCRRL